MRTSSSSQPLWPWICWPLLALALLVLGLVWMPTNDCSGEFERDELADGFVLVVLGLSFFGCLAAGIWSLAKLEGGPPTQVLAIVVAGVLLFLLVILFAGLNQGLVSVGAVGAVLTGAALLALLAAWIGGRDRREAGLLVPGYLLGMATFVLPGTTLFGLLVHAGGC